MTINIDIKLKRASKIYHEGVYLSTIYNNIIILNGYVFKSRLCF